MQTIYQIINTKSALKDIANVFLRWSMIGVDLEADSMYHFREKVCLLQMATKRINVIIDPLQISDLSMLKPIFANHRVKKVFHGADYDVRSLYRDFKIEINNLFDTQLAAMFLGLKETGLEAVIKERFNVTLEKKYQRKDWSRRPLTLEMLAYAANDVSYLIPLAENFENELRKKGRLQWVREECDCLSKVRPVQNNLNPLFLNFKGSGRLAPRDLAVLEGLLQYRKKIAAQKDKPLFKIFRNQSLMTLAIEKPIHKKKLEKTKALSPKQIGMYGVDVIETIKRALILPDKKLPVYPRKKAPLLKRAVPKRLKALKAWRNAKARALVIDPAVLFNRTLLNAIAVENPRHIQALGKIAEIKNWQKNEFGQEIISVLRKVN
ncbi:MAG: HRDC domain-containing protein [Deltaproteobacteria bacterium]|nr:MAG: HRDC domain-containing protein [Deltaproteobacteria bacterium]